MKKQNINSQHPKANRKNLMVVIISLLFVCICSCILLLYFFVIAPFIQSDKENPVIQEKLTTFLQNVSSDNIEGAYALTSELFKDTQSLQEFRESINLYEAQYSGFSDLIPTKTFYNIAPWSARTCDYSGVITYNDGDSGTVTAILIKEGNEWKIQAISVNVDLKRYNDFN